MPAVPTGAATLPMQRCKATGRLPDMPQRSEDRAMSKSTCTAQRGRGYAPGPWSHAESMAEKQVITLYTPVKGAPSYKAPPPQSLMLLSGISMAHAYAARRVWICRTVRRKQTCAVSSPGKLRRFCYLKRVRTIFVFVIRNNMVLIKKKVRHKYEIRSIEQFGHFFPSWKRCYLLYWRHIRGLNGKAAT